MNLVQPVGSVSTMDPIESMGSVSTLGRVEHVGSGGSRLFPISISGFFVTANVIFWLTSVELISSLGYVSLFQMKIWNNDEILNCVPLNYSVLFFWFYCKQTRKWYLASFCCCSHSPNSSCPSKCSSELNPNPTSICTHTIHLFQLCCLISPKYKYLIV